MERLGRIHPSQLLVCVGKTQLITRGKPVNLIEPEAGKQIRHGRVRPNNERPLRHICMERKHKRLKLTDDQK